MFAQYKFVLEDNDISIVEQHDKGNFLILYNIKYSITKI